LGFMEHFTKEFEMRRVIFGLISILRCPADAFPQLIQQRLPELFKTTADLVMRQFTERMKTLEENEKDIKEEQEERAKDLAEGKDPEDDFEDEDDSDEDLDDDEEFEKTKRKLEKFRQGGNMDDDDDLDDDDDSDYEEAGGDTNLYDSKLDDLDELNFMKETMQALM